MKPTKASIQIYQALSNLFNYKVYPLIKPESEQAELYAVYTILNTTPEKGLTGYLGYELAYCQIDIYSKSYDTTEDTTNKAIEALENSIDPFHFEDRQYLYEKDTALYRIKIDCYIWQSTINT